MSEQHYPNNIGKSRVITSIDGKKVTLVVTDEIIVPQGADKLIYFQKLKSNSTVASSIVLLTICAVTNPAARVAGFSVNIPSWPRSARLL